MLISKEKTPILTFAKRPCHHRLMDERETASSVSEPDRSAQEHLFDLLRQLGLLCGVQPGGMSTDAQARLLTFAKRQLRAAEATERLAFYLYGPAGSGRRTLVRDLCNRLKIPLLAFDAVRMASSQIGWRSK